MEKEIVDYVDVKQEDVKEIIVDYVQTESSDSRDKGWESGGEVTKSEELPLMQSLNVESSEEE